MESTTQTGVNFRVHRLRVEGLKQLHWGGLQMESMNTLKI